MKTELKQIIQELKEVIKDENLNIMDKDLLEFSIRLFNTNQINDSKKPFPKKDFNDLNNEKPIENQLATDKQLYALKKLKVSFPNNISKLEASKLINQYKQ